VFNHGIDGSHSPTRRESIREYHERLGDLCSVPTRTGSRLTDGGDVVEETPEAVDLFVVEIDGHAGNADAERLGQSGWDGSLLLVRSRDQHERIWLSRLLDQWIF
jgi:hypothetical protein